LPLADEPVVVAERYLQRAGLERTPQREADSRNVRVLDFERALSQLAPTHQQILILTYRAGIRHAEAATCWS